MSLGSEKMQALQDDRRGQQEWESKEQGAVLPLLCFMLLGDDLCKLRLQALTTRQLLPAGFSQTLAGDWRVRRRKAGYSPPSASCKTSGSDCLPHGSKSPDRPAMLGCSFSWGILAKAWITPPAPFSSPTSGAPELACTDSQGQMVKYSEFCKLVVKLLLA